MFDVRKGEITTDYIPTYISGLDQTVDEQCLLISTKGEQVHLYERETGNVLKTYFRTNSKNNRFPAKLSFDNNLFVSGNCSKAVSVFSLMDVFLKRVSLVKI